MVSRFITIGRLLLNYMKDSTSHALVKVWSLWQIFWQNMKNDHNVGMNA